jgi:hypothetical protein
MLEMGVPVGGGTDATRVSGYNPWITLYWLTTGKTIGGTPLYDNSNRLERMDALRLRTHGSAWFTSEQAVKGTIEPGRYADFAMLSDDYFSVEEEKIKNIKSVLTALGGKVVYADAEFKHLSPPELPVSPDWSPVGKYGGYYNAQQHRENPALTVAASSLLSKPNSVSQVHEHHHHTTIFGDKSPWNLDCPCYLG